MTPANSDLDAGVTLRETTSRGDSMNPGRPGERAGHTRDGLILTGEDGNCILVRADGDDLAAVVARAQDWAAEEGYELTDPGQVRLQWIRAVPCPGREHTHEGWSCDRGPGVFYMPGRPGRGAFQGVLADVTYAGGHDGV